MRRITMTPITKQALKQPTTPSRNSIAFPRQSIMKEEELRKRDVRSVREKNYKQSCADLVFKFLSENDYEGPISQKTLQNPSVKEFQSIFKFLYSFIDSAFEYSFKFEEDVLNIIKTLKYPFCSEINRSQLIATTPHTWPVILSMLAWLIELIIYSNSLINEDNYEDSKAIEDLFYEFTVQGYIKFMEGDEDDYLLEEDLEKKVSDLYVETFKEIEKKREYLKELEDKINSMEGVFEDKKVLENRKKEIIEDMNMLVTSKNQLEEKGKKYQTLMNKYLDEIRVLREEIKELKGEQQSLKTQIENQKINPEDVKEMNAEKIELFKELEKIKPQKESLLKSFNSLETSFQEKIEEIDKLLFDLKHVRASEKVPLNLIKEKNDEFGLKDDYKLMGDLCGYYKKIEDEIIEKRQLLSNLEDEKNSREEQRNEYYNFEKESEETIKYLNDKLFNIGKLYLEKKEISEIEQRKSRKEMEKIENELLKLNLESNNALLMSEQSLQKSKIVLDRTIQTINYEREEINKIVFNFYNNLRNQYGIIQNYVKEFVKLLD